MRILSFLIFLGLQIVYPQEDALSASNISENLIYGANAVIRDHSIYVKLLSKYSLEANYTRIVTVLNEKGNKHTNTMVGYNNGIDITRISAEIFDKEGKSIKKIKKKDFLDVSAVDGGTLYSDSRVLYANYLPLDYPYTIKFSYQSKTKNTGNIPSWYFLDDFFVSTESTEYTIEFAETALKPIILEKNFGEYGISLKETNNSISYVLKNVKAIKDENLRPSMNKILPRLMVCPVNFHYEGFDGTINNWKEAGFWMNNNLLKDQDNLNASTIAMMKNLVAGVDDNLEKAKIIYRYIQENTRYISVQVGIGGLRPISAVEVDRLKYGDCKGLTNYTKALLKAVDVESYYVHVEAGEDKIDFEEDTASLGQGNHVILAIPHKGKYFWIDCTSQSHPFGFIGSFTDDRKVLLIKPNGGEIVKTESYLDEQNLQTTKSNYVINERGDISGDITIITNGIQYDQHFQLENLPNLDIENYYKSYWSNINNLEIKSFVFENNRDSVLFKESLKVKADRYASVSNNNLIFVATPFNNSQFIPRRNRNRVFPVEISRGFLDCDEYEIEIPGNYTLESLPENSHIETKFGEYSLNFETREDIIKVTRKLLIKSGTYLKSDYNPYRIFRRNIAKLDNSKIILTKKI
ncbi:DUF3857 domain-containing protein [Flagellimonas sp. 389]|uniref:DUF3857 domain-containing protein n=1 Tax=Flagellimonas sp. 389 TaxID=2835862 RepID=UPI001BD2A02B|nr:DUF3857 domain-containing protein [Flagellimonas sp. 389]MBS9462288.1 DUF3857 domain-containing protein [Flagellimonas sp. 389]